MGHYDDCYARTEEIDKVENELSQKAEDVAQKLQDTIDRLEVEEKRIEKERNLEVWRQAYNAALAGGTVTYAIEAEEIADAALERYCLKRKEIGL